MDRMARSGMVREGGRGRQLRWRGRRTAAAYRASERPRSGTRPYPVLGLTCPVVCSWVLSLVPTRSVDERRAGGAGVEEGGLRYGDDNDDGDVDKLACLLAGKGPGAKSKRWKRKRKRGGEGAIGMNGCAASLLRFRPSSPITLTNGPRTAQSRADLQYRSIVCYTYMFLCALRRPCSRAGLPLLCAAAKCTLCLRRYDLEGRHSFARRTEGQMMRPSVRA